MSTDRKVNTKEWMTIPVLPCVSLDETMDFWESLGFVRTYYQNRPYQYGVVERGGYELHFGRVKGLQPENSYNGCLIMVADVQQVHKEFSECLKAHYGKVLHAGLPRISRMKLGATRFTLTDPSGNSVIFISLGEDDGEAYDLPDQEGLSPLQRKLALTLRFRDFKNDDEAAAKTLDAALRHIQGENAIDVAEALLTRADLARERNEAEVEAKCYAKLVELQLSKQEVEMLRQKVEITGEIEQLLDGS